MHSFKIAAVACLLAILISSVYSASSDLGAFEESLKAHKLAKREPKSADRFSFAEEEDGTKACCPCGGHTCCGSMCHG